MRAAAISLVLLIGVSCVARPPAPVDLQKPERLVSDGDIASAAAEFVRILAAVEDRELDYEVQIARARIHFILFEHAEAFEKLPEGKRGPFVARKDHLTLAGRHAIDLLGDVAPPEKRTEAADIVARVFSHKAGDPSLRLSGRNDEVCTYLLYRIAECFKAWAEPDTEHHQSSTALARIIAGREESSEEYRAVWKGFAKKTPDPRSDRIFAGLILERHLQEGTHAQDLGTQERASQGDLKQVLMLYLEALQHFIVVEESSLEPTVPQRTALGAMELLYTTIERLSRKSDRR